MTLQMRIWKCTFNNINTPDTSCSRGGLTLSIVHWINLYKRDGIIGFPNSYLLDSDLSGPSCSKGGNRYPLEKSLSSG